MSQHPLIADFRNFLYLIWKHLHLPDPTPIQYDIATYLQHGPSRQIIEGFRGVGKSWITSAFVLWSLYRDPQIKFLVVSASKSRSDDFSAFTQRLIREVPLLTHLKPTHDQRDSKLAFDVGPSRAAHAPSVKSVGIMGQLTGSRATHIIADDVEVAQNSLTQDMRDKLVKACTEFEAIIVPEVGRITYLGTPQTEESVYNTMRERGYDARIWPARYPSKPEMYSGALAPIIYDRIEKEQDKCFGLPTDPQRFTHNDLIEREAAYGRSGFALQFMLDTSLSDADKYPLKTSDLIVMDLATDQAPSTIQYGSADLNKIKDIPAVGFQGDRWYSPMYIDKEWVEYSGAVMAIDPSGRGADETAYAIVKQLHGKLFLLECGGLAGGYTPDVLKTLAIIAKKYQVNEIVIESNFGDGMFTQLLKPVLTATYPCTTNEVRHHTQKEMRIIDTLEPVLNSHRLVVDKQLVKDDIEDLKKEVWTSLFYQMTRITRARGALKHDDRLDCVSMAVSYWLNAMSQDEALAADAYREAALNEELRKFEEHVLFQRQRTNTWSSVR